MATLSSIILAKNPTFQSNETNLENGKIFYQSPNQETAHCHIIAWKSPGAGTVRVEIWGAGGSGGKMCCCGGGVGGNPGAYVSKTFLVDANSKVCGCIGASCGNADTMCYRGRSTGTCICWFGAASDSTLCGCLCAEGGEGGTSWCSASSSNFCCAVADAAFCTTAMTNPAGSAWGTGCGRVCNTRNTTEAATIANAYGGDINCPGGMSCTDWYACDSADNCRVQWHMRTPAGVHSTCGATVTFSGDHDSAMSKGGTAQYQATHKYALEAASRAPEKGIDLMLCYHSRLCGCYENNGCQPTLPHGHGGAPASTCNSVRDQGQRGGMGAVRILWTAT
jgi:hypothetical protein